MKILLAVVMSLTVVSSVWAECDISTGGGCNVTECAAHNDTLTWKDPKVAGETASCIKIPAEAKTAAEDCAKIVAEGTPAPGAKIPPTTVVPAAPVKDAPK